MKLRYKVISFSSQDSNAPISNLLSGKEVWESARFCEYPQQITLQFYEPITIGTLTIVSHPTKIASRINILFCLPQDNRPLDFQRYGFISLHDNSQHKYKYREQKRISNINKNILYLRLMLWKNHQNPHNFFNQVGLSQVIVHGSTYTGYILPQMSKSQPFSIDDYLDSKFTLLNQFKDQFTKQDDFESAKQIKQIIKVVKVQGEKIKGIDIQKRQAVQQQKYDLAKTYKQQIEQVKQDVNYICSNFYDPQKKTLIPVLNNSKLKARIDELMMEHSLVVSGNQSRIKLSRASEEDDGEEENSSEENERESFYNSRISYEDQIVPAVLHKEKKDIKTLLNTVENLEDAAYEGNEFIEKFTKSQQQEGPEDMSPSAEANASVMYDFYDKQLVKKLHSKNWNYKHEAITKISADTGELKGKTIEKNRVRCILFAFNKCIKQGSLPITQAAIQTLHALSQCRVKNVHDAKPELHHELDKTLNELIIRMSDNQKLRQKSDSTITLMLQNELFGVFFCTHSIIKSYKSNPNPRVKKIQLEILEMMVRKYGMGSDSKSVPEVIIDFGIKAAEETNGDLRKEGGKLLKSIKENGGNDRLKGALNSKPNLKNSIIRQLK